MISLIILAVIAAFCVFLLSLKIKVKTSFKDNIFNLKISAFGITLFDNSKKKPVAEKNVGNKETPEKEKTDILKFLITNKDGIYKDLKEILRFVKKKIHINNFFFELVFGVKDAADTGILCGGIWSFIGTVFPLIESSFAFDNTPQINVIPVFNKISFVVEYKGNYTLRIIHILRLGIKLLFKFLKYKGGVNNGSTASN